MSAPATDNTWRNCNICKKPIAFGAEHFVCSVSTCNRKRTSMYFCSLPCFEAHVPMERHRDAWAEARRAPSRAEWEASLAARDEADADAQEARAPAAPPVRHKVALSASAPERPPSEGSEAAQDVLVVVSKLKKYVKDWSGMNTSDAAMSVLSDHLRELCREATRCAGQDGRKTVLDRDFVKVIEQRRDSR